MGEPGKLTCGVIGAGRIGQLHAKHLSHRTAQAELTMISDIAEHAARQCAEECHGVPYSTEYHDILNHADIQAVLICSSTDTHARMIEEAAAAGKHIFCEKPIDHDLDRIDSALAAVNKAGVLLQVGFNRRFDANYQRVRQAVQSGEIGEPHLMHIISRDPAPPPIEYIRVSGGIFLDMTIHDFDMARFLIGSEVEEVYTAGAVRVDERIGAAGDIDTLMIMLKFANGVIATIDNSRQAVYGYDQRVEVFGSGGCISVANNYPNAATIQTKRTVHRDLPLNFFLERYIDSYLKEIDQFVKAVLNGSPVPVSGSDGRLPVVMAHAARKSYEENRPVRLDEIE
jgi:myo-inositol 2-dehydrogenase/D-chiro-inositol 1-dehydrogenase